jgi:hypothetical protein
LYAKWVTENAIATFKKSLEKARENKSKITLKNE